MGIVGIENDFDTAGAIIEVEIFFPGLAAITRAVNAAFGVGAVSVSECGDEHDIGVFGMDDDVADVARFFEADVGPGLSSVGGFVNAVPEGDVAADAGFAGAGINHVGIRIGNGNRADGGDARRAHHPLFSRRRR